MAERAGQAASAEAVYLFGSRAKGSSRADSDYDFALILDDDSDPWNALLAAQRALWPREVSVDFAPITKKVWMGSRNSFVNSVRDHGQLLYSRDG